MREIGDGGILVRRKTEGAGNSPLFSRPLDFLRQTYTTVIHLLICSRGCQRSDGVVFFKISVSCLRTEPF